MNSIQNRTKRIDTRVLLSTLWIVVIVSMLKADILSLYIPGAADNVAKTAGEIPIPQLMLVGAIMMEISIVMIILSYVLKYKVSRWTNLFASIITIVFVVCDGVSYPHYIFIATIEILCLLLIIWISLKWREPEGLL